MNTRRFTNKIVGLFLIGCMVSSVCIPHCYAITTQKHASSVTKDKKIPSLGPMCLEGFVNKNMSGIFIMDSYTENIQKQSTADFSTANLIEKDLKMRILQHHNQAKQHAIEWQQDIKNSMLETNQTIIQFNLTFQETAQSLADFIEKKDRDNTKTQIKKLYEQVTRNKQEADTMLVRIHDFQDKLNTDQQHFNTDFVALRPALATMGIDIPRLQQQITDLNDEIKKERAQLQQGEVLCLTIVGAIVGGPMIVKARLKIMAAQDKIDKLMGSIYGIQREIAIITDVQKKTLDMTETIKTVVNAFQQISIQWSLIQVKYEAVLNAIDTIDPEMFEMMQSDLAVAKKDWQDLKEYVERLYELYTKDGSVATFSK
ncbi:HBL/NHE enterotoxin family protein [Bacillus thuringiensis]|nr:HBL/NHE enterotoxin family protein [Bacillus cereus]MED3392412.1 HBL/NHE enterotoxin family protein [Bacillus thuringiensis]